MVSDSIVQASLMIKEILSRKRSEHGDDHVHRVLVKLIFTQGLSARRDQGEEGMMVLLVSTGHCAFLLSHTPKPLYSMLVYKFLCMSQHCWVRRAVHLWTQPRSLHVFPEQGRSCASASNIPKMMRICQQLTHQANLVRHLQTEEHANQ